MPTIEQIRAARALVGWSQGELAEQADLSQTGIARIENGTNKPNSQTLAKIQAAFDRADVEFIGDNGVKKRSDEVKVLKGTDGFRRFMEDVYVTVRDHGGEICLFNAKPERWYQWLGEEWYKMHSKRMSEITVPYEFKVTVEKGEALLIGNKFAEYRWFLKDLDSEKAFYAYGDKIGFLTFEQDEVRVTVLKNLDFANGFRTLFNVAWDSVTESIPQD